MVIQICFTCNFSVSQPISSFKSTEHSHSLLINDHRSTVNDHRSTIAFPLSHFLQSTRSFPHYRDNRQSNFHCNRFTSTYASIMWNFLHAFRLNNSKRYTYYLSIPVVLGGIECVQNITVDCLPTYCNIKTKNERTRSIFRKGGHPTNWYITNVHDSKKWEKISRRLDRLPHRYVITRIKRRTKENEIAEIRHRLYARYIKI